MERLSFEYPIYFKDGSYLTEDKKLHVPCSVCGEFITTTQRGRREYRVCEECKKKIRAMKPIPKEVKAEQKDKFERRFDRAVEKIKKQVGNFEEYKRAIELAETRMYQYGSSPEAMVAIELLRLKYRVIPQQKIDRYTVDFALPDEKLIIEIDGSLYHAKNKTPDREARIQFAIGFDWKIIHIPAELIEKDIRKLQKCIDLYLKK